MKAYLENGQEVILQEQIGDKYIVNKIYEFTGYDGDVIEKVSDESIVVDKIFKTAPVEKINLEIEDLQNQKRIVKDELLNLRKEKINLESEIRKVTKTITNNDKFIINKNDIINAKNIVVFVKDTILPIRMINDKDSFSRIKIQFEISISRYKLEGEENVWVYKLYKDSNIYSSSLLVDKFYGILIDPTDEEVDLIIKKRVNEIHFSDWDIHNTPDEYLTPKLIELKKEIAGKHKMKQTDKIKKQIENLNNQLKELE